MILKTKIQENLTLALKEKNSATTLVYRNILAKITEFEKANSNKVVNDDEVLKVVEKLAKQREESIKLFKEGGRLDLAEKEESELNLLKSFLPTKFTEQETKEIILELIDSGCNTMALLMKQLNNYGNKLDKKLASEIIKTLI
jgi:uncharacterized protein YqeY